MKVKEWSLSSRTTLCMISVQIFTAGMQCLSRIILNQGTSIFALMTYRHVVAAIFVAPFAAFFERGVLKKITWTAGVWIFFNSFIGITMAMGLFYYGLKNTTATYSSNFISLVPIVTFILSVILRLERLNLGKMEGRMKVGGTLLCLAGALTYSLYHGKAFHVRPHDTLHNSPHQIITIKHTRQEWFIGTFMLMGSCLSYATWFLIQVKLANVFPSRYWTTVLTCIMATMQSMPLGLCLDRSSNSWRLGWNLELITIIYSGALASGATFCITLWVIKRKGPVYPAAFNPLCLIFVAISEALLFNEAFTVGGILGMLMIIIGLYAFLWGKKEETSSVAPSNSSTGDIVMVPESLVMKMASKVKSDESQCKGKDVEDQVELK